jgi:hypothetical protein
MNLSQTNFNYLNNFISKNDSDYSTEDIVFWCEIPAVPKLDCIEIYGVDEITKTIKSTREQFLKEIPNK